MILFVYIFSIVIVLYFLILNIMHVLLRRLLFVLTVVFVLSCSEKHEKNILNNYKENLCKTYNYITDTASKYSKKFNNNMGCINRTVKNSILPSFLLFNNLFTLTNSQNELFINTYPLLAGIGGSSQSLTSVDTERIGFAHAVFFLVNQTNGETIDELALVRDINNPDSLTNILDVITIDTNPDFFVSVSVLDENDMFLTGFNFTDIFYSKNISRDSFATIPIFDSIVKNDNNTVGIINLIENYILFSAFDAIDGQNLYNRSYNFTNNTFEVHLPTNLITDQNEFILLGVNADIKSDNSQGFVFKITDENSLPVNFTNFNIPTSNVTFPTKIIKSEEDYIIVGYTSFADLEKNCFIFRLNSDFSEVLNSKLIVDVLNLTTTTSSNICFSIEEKQGSFYIGGAVGSTIFGNVFFISQLDSGFQIINTRYYPDNFGAILDSKIVNNNLFFSAIPASLIKLPLGLSGNCTTNFTLGTIPLNISIGTDDIVTDTNPEIIITDSNMDLFKDFEVNESAICREEILTTDPTVDPTTDPTVDLTTDPTVDLTTDPTVDPTKHPSIYPTKDPTSYPTKYPTLEPLTVSIDDGFSPIGLGIVIGELVLICFCCLYFIIYCLPRIA